MATTPNAPTLNSPIGSLTIDLGVIERFSFTYSNTDPTDAQSAFDLQYRVIGAPSWTNVNVVTPYGYYDFPASTFTANNYEWQVRTYDSIGLVGPWSASSFFTAAVQSATLSITAPTSGSTLGATATITWSTPTQTDYEVRRVRDLAGVPDTTTIYFDSGDVVDTATRSLALSFSTNNRYEHLQVRIKTGGLWTAWVSERVLVSYIQPSPGTVSIAPSIPGASLIVTTTAAAVGGGEPTPLSVDIYIREVGTTGYGDRVAAAITPTGIWTYWTPKSGVQYEARTLTTGSNGAQRWSAVIFTHIFDGGPAIPAVFAILLDGGNASTVFTNIVDGGTA